MAMKLGMIGLGRMGGNMVQRLEQDGHDVVTYTRSGGGTASTIEELVSELDPEEPAGVLLERVIAEASDAPDDMTLCLLRPLYGAATRSPRIEVLELDADDLDSGFAARFIDACGVPADDLPATVELAREIVSTDGMALLQVAIADGVARAAVMPVPQAAAPPTAA